MDARLPQAGGCSEIVEREFHDRKEVDFKYTTKENVAVAVAVFQAIMHCVCCMPVLLVSALLRWCAPISLLTGGNGRCGIL